MSAPGAPSIVVIGAGPAGLAFARELRRRGGRCRLLERGEAPGDSWRRMPRHMTLNSAWGASTLPGTRFFPLAYARRRGRAFFHAYLLDYARRHGIPVETGVRVERVVREPAAGEPRPGPGFRLETSAGPIRTRLLVNATGYFAKPWLPSYPGRDASSLLHLAIPEYHSPERLGARLGPGRRRVLLVGARITAGQLALELHDAGFHVTLSHRTPLAFGWPPFLQQLGFAPYYAWEALRLRLGDTRFARRDSGHPMPGGRVARLVRRQAIRTVGPIDHFEDEKVVFADGSVDRPDAVLWATGYRPALDHLGALVSRDAETGLPPLVGAGSAEAPGLYFLGLDQQTDFTSRMLRGIRRDARRLARELAARTEG